MDQTLSISAESTSRVAAPTDFVHDMDTDVSRNYTVTCERQRKVRRIRSAPELSHPSPETDDYLLLDDNEQSALSGLENAITEAKRRTSSSKSLRESGSGRDHWRSQRGERDGRSGTGYEPTSRSKTRSTRRTRSKDSHVRPVSKQNEIQAHGHQHKGIVKTDSRSHESSPKSIVDNDVTDATTITPTVNDRAASRATVANASEVKRGLEPDSLMRLANSSLVQRGLDSATTSTIVTGVVSAIVGGGGTAAGAATWWLAYKSRQRNRQERDIELQEISDRLADETNARRELDIRLKSLNEQVELQQKDIERRHDELDRKAQFLHARAGQLESEAIEQRNQMTAENGRTNDARIKHLELCAAELQELKISMEDKQQKLDKKEDWLRKQAVTADMVAAQREKCVNDKVKAWEVEFKEQGDMIKKWHTHLVEEQARFEKECQQLVEVEQLWIAAVEQLQTKSEDLTRREKEWQLELEESKTKIAAQRLELELLRSQLEGRSEAAFNGTHTAEQEPPSGDDESAELQESPGASSTLSFGEQTSVTSECSSPTRQKADLRQRWADFLRKT